MVESENLLDKRGERFPYSIALEIPRDATYEKNVMCLSFLSTSLTNMCYKMIDIVNGFRSW